MSHTRTARQFWIRAPGLGEIVQTVLAPRQAGQVLVRAVYSGISRGTESLVFRGEVPPSQYQVMRAPFQEGDFPAPVKYGYTSVGRIEEAPDDAQDLVGRMVWCLYPHQDLYCVPATAVVPLPEGLPPGRAVLAANMETAVNAVWDGQPAPGDRIVVIGAGVVGLLIAWLCQRLPGATVTVVDINPAREPVARALDLSWRASPPPGTAADVVFHASGQPAGLTAALATAGLEATVVEVSWYGTRSVPLPLGEAFHSARLTIRSSQVSRIPPGRAPRWTHARRAVLALDLLRDPALDVLITDESPFEDLPRVLAALSRDPGTTLCHRIAY